MTDQIAMESRTDIGDLAGKKGTNSPNYNMEAYRNLMLGKNRRMQSQFGGRPRSMSAQSSFSPRAGGVSGNLGELASNQLPIYTDYQDYDGSLGTLGGLGSRAVGTLGAGAGGSLGSDAGSLGTLGAGAGSLGALGAGAGSLGALGAGAYGSGARRTGLSGYGGSGYGAQQLGGSGYGGMGSMRSSGYGAPVGGTGYSPVSVVSGYGPGVCEDKGLNPALVLATLAGAAVAFFVIYRQVTSGGKRTIDPTVDEFVSHLSSLFWTGLEEFEEKIDKIADGEDAGDDSWISKIYNQFSFFNDGDNSLAEADMDGLEPPILDETWGLGVRKTDITANTTVSRAVALDESEKETGRTKRSVEEGVIEKNSEDTEAIKDIKDPEEKCRVDMWRCLSQVIEGGLHYMDRPEGLMGLAKKTMFKMAFHGGLSNLWSGVMTIPEARAVKHCMTSHTECVSYEILRREAQATLDPTDPAYSMYDRGTGTRGETQEPASQGKESKRERLIINPEYVESLDTGDGSVQYDEDYTENHI